MVWSRWTVGLGFRTPLSSPPPKRISLLGSNRYYRGMVRKADGLLLECTKCKRMLPRGRFDRRGKGKASWCKECLKPYKASAAATRQKRMVGRGKFKAEDVKHLYVVQGARCKLCSRHLGITGYHVDHVIPIARGGLNVAYNLQLLCPKCNLSKGKK